MSLARVPAQADEGKDQKRDSWQDDDEKNGIYEHDATAMILYLPS